ncbi:hypothetical protein RU820_06150 [Acidithiobacillus ferrooxidans]|uniref:Uncharacterized protein n=1 Tax=Acidithiobacillus ferrooxidans (strain ATCC 23270 / DSM 14882 / CIP 104768 / NCIMB 8455) TaxID=243159 RepID=B7J8X3_ACIF2|nr:MULTISPECIES: hypothetical protein [Acidithiobacillus]ACK77912.1 hypothetical protein AFE_1291 [Acidithiobacillus ferrooxidans ATCC 23270]MBN6744335.1 hypothetical protein [Acidithiobacillus sp. MC2.2]MBN6747294.1 hypothetical protein [Acidithiobacillus sp. PG05]
MKGEIYIFQDVGPRNKVWICLTVFDKAMFLYGSVIGASRVIKRTLSTKTAMGQMAEKAKKCPLKWQDQVEVDESITLASAMDEILDQVYDCFHRHGGGSAVSGLLKSMREMSTVAEYADSIDSKDAKLSEAVRSIVPQSTWSF